MSVADVSSAQTIEAVRPDSALPAELSPAPERPLSAFVLVAVRWLVWGPAAVIVVSATAAVGGLALFLLPLAAVFYGVVALIAWVGPDRH